MKLKSFRTKLFRCGKRATIIPKDRLFIQSMKIDGKPSIARVDRKTAKKLKKGTRKDAENKTKEKSEKNEMLNNWNKKQWF